MPICAKPSVIRQVLMIWKTIRWQALILHPVEILGSTQQALWSFATAWITTSTAENSGVGPAESSGCDQ